MSDQNGPIGDAGEKNAGSDFIRTIIADDLATGKHTSIVTRFPPEPNGYLHIGHAKAICINYGIAEEFGGRYNLRMDDTNPEKEDIEYAENIMKDIRWLGFDWGKNLYYASDYYEILYNYAERLIQDGKAYVDDQTADEVRENRGTLVEGGKASPYRDRSVAENLDLFRRMRAGEFADGNRVLRAKIDMASPNICMRDPSLYRIRRTSHWRTGDAWCIYPMYDFAHCLSDATEGITHSLCSLEFENNRPLYDWFINALPVPHKPRQIEFARLNLTYTVMSKRKLLQLVKEKHVAGWDDPRMPTLSGMRRRGFPPEAIRAFVAGVGVAKVNSVVDYALLEYYIRENLNKAAPRRMAVLDPLKVVITNYPEGQVEEFDAENNPEDPASGTRKVPFSRELAIEREDFQEVPPKGYFRLSPGKEIRLKHAYYVTCTEVIKNADGRVVELRCTYDPASRGGWSQDGRNVKGTSHWVSLAHAAKAEVRVYDRLFAVEDPNAVENFLACINPDSLKVMKECLVEPSLADAKPGERYQFLRQGYYAVDPDSAGGRLVFNKTVGLKDAWAKAQKKS